MIARSARVAVVAAVAAVVLGGCGSGSSSGGTQHRARKASHGASANSQTAPTQTTTLPSPAPTGIPADPTAVRVIRAWATALRNGDLRLAAHYFALPSEMINGGGGNGVVVVIRIRTIAQAAYANATLPCGATFVSADQRGRYVNALFRLSGRRGPGGTSCSGGAGLTARTNFVIAGGRIVEWIRAPDDPGDNGSPTQPTPSAPTTGNSGPVA